MAVNHADMSTLGAFVAAPLVAGITAWNAHAGWFTLIFVILGLVGGFIISYLVRSAAYLILNAGVSQTRVWIAAPLLLIYMLLPVAIAAFGCLGISIGVRFLVAIFIKS
jgi:hypothetical protein